MFRTIKEDHEFGKSTNPKDRRGCDTLRSVSHPRLSTSRNPISPNYLLWVYSCKLIIYCERHAPESNNYLLISFTAYGNKKISRILIPEYLSRGHLHVTETQTLSDRVVFVFYKNLQTGVQSETVSVYASTGTRNWTCQQPKRKRKQQGKYFSRFVRFSFDT
jgi:hypothetical protein